MKSAAVKAELVSALGSRFGSVFQLQEKPPPETISTGIAAVDSLIGGLPRGAITEICGPASSGRTSLLLAVLAQATARQEVCALVDTTDAFDPASGAAAGIDLDRLLWARCGGNPEHALKVADLLAHGGGFGVVVLDLGNVPDEHARRIPLTSWFRLLRAIERTPTALVVLEREPYAKSCSSLVLQMHREGVAWSRILRGARLRVERRKPVRSATAAFEVRALA